MQPSQRTRQIGPVCETCNNRPKMDRSDCCEECWYSGRYTAKREYTLMTPAEQHRLFLQRACRPELQRSQIRLLLSLLDAEQAASVTPRYMTLRARLLAALEEGS